MADNQQMGSRELVLPQGTYAYVLDSTKGKVAVSVGPFKTSLSNTDKLVNWDAKAKRYVDVQDPGSAIQVFTVAAEGQYLVLTNPSTDPTRYPTKGTVTDATDLEVGRKVNLPGPITFPLWPGQVAQSIDGHRLRHNEYLIVRVYDEQQALKNWRSAVIAPQNASSTNPTDPGKESTDVEKKPEDQNRVPSAPMLTMGKLMVVKGNEVSFFIPPTGIEVVAEPGADNHYVRSAVTLERLEYCVLLDENGEKRYVQGPDVVFPEPTEKFIEDGQGNRKYRAIELNEQSGLYIKVIAEYTEGDRAYKVGEELFVRGNEMAIYFPREEHSIIEYDTKKKHYSIAIPAGEGRYVLDRTKGTVDLVKGPKMFLPDPRTQVVVRRILDDQAVELMFPGNQEARDVNRRFAQMTNRLESSDHLSSNESLQAASNQVSASRRNLTREDEFVGDAFKRDSIYSPPRTLVLDTKYAGAVAINIWPGYAVLVVKKTGERRVELGPKMVLLEYDEALMPLELSTGRPKSEARLLKSAYLRVSNNQVGDQITVETRDLVKVTIGVSYRVNFEGATPKEQLKWFEVENYVKILTDHARSRMRNAAKRHDIQTFYSGTIDILRDAILGVAAEEGTTRRGLPFTENGMRVYDIEVLEVSIEDDTVASLLLNAQKTALTGAIRLTEAESQAELTAKLEALKRATLDETELTATKTAEIALTAIERKLAADTDQVKANLQVFAEDQKLADARLAQTQKATEQEVALSRLRTTQEIERLREEAKVFASRMKAIDPTLIEAINHLGDKDFVQKIVGTIGPAALAGGTTTGDILGQLFKDTPFAGILNTLNTRPLNGRAV